MGRATGRGNKNLGALELLKGLYETIGGAGKGVASATLGFPGDLEGLLRMLTPGVSNDPYLPNTERVAKFLPGPDNTMTELGRNLPLTPTQAMKLGAPIARQAAAQVHRGMMGEGPLRGALSAVAPLNVIKDRGGNWIPQHIEQAIKPELRAQYLPELLKDPMVAPFLQPEAMEKARTMDKWVNGALKKYIMRDMATEGDPIRKLAEQGILHVDPQELNFNMSTYGKWLNPGQTLHGKSDMAKNWEGASDNAINSTPRWSLAPEPGSSKVSRDNPWMDKLPEETPIHSLQEPKNMMEDLGLDRLHQHVYDALIEGRIRPEQLNSGSFGVEAAVRDAHNVRMTKAEAEEKAALESLKGEAVFEHKAYPEGYRWVEFKEPKGSMTPDEFESANAHLGPREWDEAMDNYRRNIRPQSKNSLQKSLTAEGDYMGHCVGNYCDDVISGDKRIFALRDPEGKPHVTVEAQKGSDDSWSLNQIKGSGKKDSTQAITPEILETVQPYLKDFLNSQPWGTVRDMKNTGLRDMSEYTGHKGSRFMTLSEHDELLKANPNLRSPLSEALDDPNFNDGWIPDEHIEMAEGGLVPPPHFEDLDRFLGR